MNLLVINFNLKKAIIDVKKLRTYCSDHLMKLFQVINSSTMDFMVLTNFPVSA